MARTPLKRVSKKQSKENAELRTLVSTLRESAKSGSLYISELTSKLALRLDPHHFGGRGKNLCNPFTIIMVSRNEHIQEQKHMSYQHKQDLRALVKPLRIRQGFKEENYEQE